MKKDTNFKDEFIQITTWAMILVIPCLIMKGVVQNGWVVWFFFGFFVVAKILQWLDNVAERNRAERIEREKK